MIIKSHMVPNEACTITSSIIYYELKKAMGEWAQHFFVRVFSKAAAVDIVWTERQKCCNVNARSIRVTVRAGFDCNSALWSSQNEERIWGQKCCKALSKKMTTTFFNARTYLQHTSNLTQLSYTARQRRSINCQRSRLSANGAAKHIRWFFRETK